MLHLPEQIIKTKAKKQIQEISSQKKIIALPKTIFLKL